MTERILKEQNLLFAMIPILLKSSKNKQYAKEENFLYNYSYLQANKECNIMNYKNGAKTPVLF